MCPQQLFIISSIPMQQAEFILKSLFIVRPNQRSHYKLRIVVNQDSPQQKLIDPSDKYQFRFSINKKESFTRPYGFIVLLEQPHRQFGEERFLEIGKGNVDFNQILAGSQQEKTSLNGVIYGTRAHNYDKVIAKYQYEIIKRKVETVNQGEHPKRPKLKFKGHTKKEKLPTLKLKQSILERSEEINTKIRELTQTIQEENKEVIKSISALKNHSIVLPKESSLDKLSRNQSFRAQAQPQKYFGSQNYFYRIGDRIQKLIAENQCHQLSWIRIKNIKIFGETALSPQQALPQAILLKIYQHHHSNLIDIIADFKPHANHSFIDVLLPFPNSISLLKIDAIFHEDSWQILRGYARVLPIAKTVELCNIHEEEKGFLSLEMLKKNELQFDLEKYRHQRKGFDQLISSFCLANRILDSRWKFGDIRSVDQFKRSLHLTTDRSKRISPYDSILSKRANTELDNGYSKVLKPPKRQSLSIPKSHSKQQNFSSQKSLSVKIKNIYIHLYDYEQNGLLSLKFQTDSSSIIIHGQNGYNDLQEGSILLDRLHPAQQIVISCYQGKVGHSLGECLIDVKSLIKSSTGHLKIFMAKKEVLIGYINCQVSLYRIKNNHLKALKRKPSVQPLQTPTKEEYELSITSSQISHRQNPPKETAEKSSSPLNESVLLEQFIFY